MTTTPCSVEMWRNMDRQSGYSPIFIPRKLNCQLMKDTGTKFWSHFYGIFVSISIRKKVKICQVSKLKPSCYMYYIVYGDTCITSLRHNGRKIYAHECMYVNFHLQVHVRYMHEHEYKLMVQLYWLLLHQSYSVLIIF